MAPIRKAPGRIPSLPCVRRRGTVPMDHIRAIQEVVDEHKESMPTCVVTRVMDQCQKAYEATKLYKLTWTVVDSHAHVVEVEDEPNHAEVKLSHKTQTLIVEAVDELPVT